MLTRQIVNSARAFFNAPIPTYGVAGSYAAALYSAAKKGGDQVRFVCIGYKIYENR